MSLLTRLVDPQEGEQKIPIHQFMAATAEFVRGAPGVNADSIAAAFNLSASEKSALTTWYINHVQTKNVNREEIHDVLLLGESIKLDASGEHMYSMQQVMNRLGL